MTEIAGMAGAVDALKSRFNEFADIQTSVIRPILAESPKTIANWDEAQIKKIAEGIKTPFYQQVVDTTVSNYCQLEKQIEDWQSRDPEGAKKALLDSLSLVKVDRVDRMHGGFAIYLSPQEFQKYLGVSVYQDGKKVEDPTQLKQALDGIPEAALLLDPSEISDKPNLPKGMFVAIISNNVSAGHARQHEEAEAVGYLFDQIIQTDRRTRLLDAAPSGYKNAFLRPIAYDLAARLEEGVDQLTLSTLGIVTDDLKTHPKEIGLVYGVIANINKELKNASFEQRQRLAAIVRGGALRFENLARYFLQKDGAQPLSSFDELPSPDELPDQLAGTVLKAEKNGRFVFNKATLIPGEALSLQGIRYTVEKVLASGGQGVVYQGRSADGKLVAIKELIIEAPEALIANQYTAPAIIDGLLKNQSVCDPDKLLRDLRGLFTDRTFAEKFGTYLDTQLPTILASLSTPGNIPIYNRNTRVFKKFDSNTGNPIDYSGSLGHDIVYLIRGATAAFALTETAEEYRGELSEAIQLFIAENETLFKLYGLKGVAGSLGMVVSGELNPQQSNYNCLYMIQEFIPGENLNNVLKLESGQPELFSYQESVDFMVKFLGVLAKIHERGVIHRDIKPANLHISANGDPVILDFGIAKGDFTNLNIARAAGMRTMTTRRGTVGYHSPEHITGSTDERSDIYSSGVLLYAMVTGEEPTQSLGRFGMNSADQIEYMRTQLLQKDPLGKAVYPVELANIILKAVNMDPANRFQSATEMQTELQKLHFITASSHLDLFRGRYREVRNRGLIGNADKLLTSYLTEVKRIGLQNSSNLTDSLTRLKDDYLDDSLDIDSSFRKLRDKNRQVIERTIFQLAREAIGKGFELTPHQLEQIQSIVYTPHLLGSEWAEEGKVMSYVGLMGEFVKMYPHRRQEILEASSKMQPRCQIFYTWIVALLAPDRGNPNIPPDEIERKLGEAIDVVGKGAIAAMQNRILSSGIFWESAGALLGVLTVVAENPTWVGVIPSLLTRFASNIKDLYDNKVISYEVSRIYTEKIANLQRKINPGTSRIII